MDSSEIIQTASWPNIPTCIVTAINHLLELSVSTKGEIEELKSSISDILIKFQVKTNRIESSLQDLIVSFKTYTNVASIDIKDLQDKSEQINSTTEKKFKSINEGVNELRPKIITLQSEIRKEARESNNKLEKAKEDLQLYIDSSIDRVRDTLEFNDQNAIKKIQNAASEVKENTEKILERLKKLEDEVIVQKISGSEKEGLLMRHTEKFEKLWEFSNHLKQRIEEQEKNTDEIFEALENLSRPVEVKPQSPKARKLSRDFSIINPMIGRLQELEEKIEQIEISQKAAMKAVEHDFELDLSTQKASIESWTLSKIQENLKTVLEHFREKLEWLPDKSSSMKEMSVTEARLFLIESRIRSEEKARIISDQKLESNLLGIKEPSSTKNTKGRRGSLSSCEGKLGSTEVDKKRIKRISRPYSSYQNRELMIASEKMKDKLFYKIPVIGDH